ncbi:prokaryotic cytochrome C oxidase subunit IV family protein [Mycolicibacterium wolinskyi]|uniref:Prokaryotic cytochrome C oxidase subunit IV family protein n=1 Tax=Mycolicibacterium wolinskyi TaxID=59750 RepID=A0A132PQ04_9MYCO|nr:cytochrome C oxidase subunit IV family protein [Mycolicibacterium wolinskyi]KWX24383.1 prokaryotic cytochrome C oxidase subunit IV family protein [Mycolicibacterium wolinskyi]
MNVIRRITVVWATLCVVTVVSWWLGHGAAVASVPITVSVVALAAIKCRLIIREFMEVRTAPAWLRFGTDAWLAALSATVLAIYLW